MAIRFRGYTLERSPPSKAILYITRSYARYTDYVVLVALRARILSNLYDLDYEAKILAFSSVLLSFNNLDLSILDTLVVILFSYFLYIILEF